MEPLVSIIIPVYNAADFIIDTINSCLSQVYRNIEIIIINDGSTDNSENIILNFSDHRIRYFKTENGGPCRARNFGIQECKGELVQFLDHDDILDTNKLQIQVDHYILNGPEFIYSGVMGAIVNNKKSIERGFSFYYRNLDFEKYYKLAFKYFGKYLITGVWLVPKKLLEKSHGWDEKAGLNDDGEYFLRIISSSKGIIFCAGAIFFLGETSLLV